MKIIISGASGYIGKKLVPFLSDAGHNLFLIGRDRNNLQDVFPGIKVQDYANLSPKELEGADCCIHLATINTGHQGDPDLFFKVNVELLDEFCQTLALAGVSHHVYLSSIHADETSTTSYGRSKWEAEQCLVRWQKQHPSWKISIFRPAYIYDASHRGKFSFLNGLPTGLSRMLFDGLRSFKPTTSYTRLEQVIAQALETPDQGDATPKLITDQQHDNKVYTFLGRTLDIAFSLVGLLILIPLFPVLYLLTKLDSAGPALFIQTRIGHFGRHFECVKFRTMKTGIAQSATHEAPKNAVTRFGRRLRQTKLDELPQIWNIIMGEMSVVGPRPCLPMQEHLISLREKHGVLDVRPGLTGLAQIRNQDMSDPEKLVVIDAEYIARRTIILDLSIMLSTAIVRQ